MSALALGPLGLQLSALPSARGDGSGLDACTRVSSISDILHGSLMWCTI